MFTGLQCIVSFVSIFRRDVPREPRDMSRGGEDFLRPDIVSKGDIPRGPHRCELVVMDVDGRQWLV